MTAKTKVWRWCHPETILVTVELIDDHQLIEEAMRQARMSGSRVLLVHVLPTQKRWRGINEEHLPLSFDTSLHTTIAALHQLAAKVRHHGILCDSVILEGEPAEQIPLLIRSRNVDRVIVATRGATGVERMLTGSVAEELIAAIDVPVFAVGPNIRKPVEATPLQRILIAINFDPGSFARAKFASAIAELNHAQMTMIHVVAAGNLSRAEKMQAHRSALGTLTSYSKKMSRLRGGAVSRIEDGDPAQKILQVARSDRSDLIVLGSSSESSLTRMLADSVVHQVLRLAECPVLTLRSKVQPVHTALRELFSTSSSPAITGQSIA